MLRSRYRLVTLLFMCGLVGCEQDTPIPADDAGPLPDAGLLSDGGMVLVDECTLGMDNCSADALCTDTVEGFTCECLPGYEGDGVECNDIAAAVNLAFPPPTSATDRPTVIVRGVASDVSGVSAVMVNGVAVQTANSFATWQVEVALESGDNSLVVEVEDGLGNTTQTAAATISRQTVPAPSATVYPRILVFDAARQKLFGVQGSLGRSLSPRVYELDPITGAAKTVSSTTIGTGPSMVKPRTVAIDGAGLLLIGGGAQLLRIDPDTGNRTLVSDEDTGAGPALLNRPTGMAFDAVNNRVFLLQGDRFDYDRGSHVLAIDVATGDRTLLTGDGAGTGPFLSRDAKGLAYDPNTQRLFTSSESGVLAVDVASGARSVLAMAAGRELTADLANNRLLLTGNDEVLAVNVTTGAVSKFSGPTRGTGPAFLRPLGIAYDPAGGRAFVGTHDRTVFAVDAATGDRTAFDPAFRQGFPLERPVAVSVDRTRNRAMVLDENWDYLISIDLATGLREVFSTGETLRIPTDLTVDATEDRVLVVDRESNVGDLQGLTLSDGTASVVSSDGSFTFQVGNGPELESPREVAMAPDGTRAFVFERENDQLIAVDLATGDRTLHASDVGGKSRFMFSRTDLATDALNGRLLFVHDQVSTLVAFDLVTGAKMTVSDAGQGTGDPLNEPCSVAVAEDATRALVLTLDGLVSVSLATGDRTLLSPNTEAFGRVMQDPRAVSTSEHPERALIADAQLGLLLSVDLVTGQRVVQSGF